VSYFTQRSQSPKAQDLNFALLGLLCTSHFDSNKTRPGGNDRAKSRIQLVNGFSDVLETIDEVMEAVKNDNLFRETGAVSMTSVHVRHPHWHGPLVYNDTCKEGFSNEAIAASTWHRRVLRDPCRVYDYRYCCRGDIGLGALWE
jgi:hypothetical protein